MYNGRGKPLVSHCIFSRNKTSIQFSSGGGMHNAEKSEAVVTHCTFSENTALKGYGGGMFNMGTSRPTIAYCTFSENNVGDGSGGGIEHRLEFQYFPRGREKLVKNITIYGK